jgi:hypothetical protein
MYLAYFRFEGARVGRGGVVRGGVVRESLRGVCVFVAEVTAELSKYL